MAQSGNFWGSKVKYVEGGRKFQKSKKFVENPSHETQHPVIAAIFIVKTKNFEILLTVCPLGRFPLYFLTVRPILHKKYLLQNLQGSSFLAGFY